MSICSKWLFILLLFSPFSASLLLASQSQQNTGQPPSVSPTKPPSKHLFSPSPQPSEHCVKRSGCSRQSAGFHSPWPGRGWPVLGLLGPTPPDPSRRPHRSETVRHTQTQTARYAIWAMGIKMMDFFCGGLTGSISMVPGGPGKPSAPGRPARPGGPWCRRGDKIKLIKSISSSLVQLYKLFHLELKTVKSTVLDNKSCSYVLNNFEIIWFYIPFFPPYGCDCFYFYY